MNEIMWYLSFLDLLISLSTILSISIHIVANGKISFFFLKILFIYLRERMRDREHEREEGQREKQTPR